MKRRIALALPFLILTGAACRLAAQTSGDPVILSFIATGDTRLDPTFPNKLKLKDAPPSVLAELGYQGKAGDDAYPYFFNAVQLRQTLKDVATLAPDFLFFTGDMVMGFGKDSTTLSKELAPFGQAINKYLPGNRTKVVILPGNHGLTYKAFTPILDPVTQKPVLDAKGKPKFSMSAGLESDNEKPLLQWLDDNNFNTHMNHIRLDDPSTLEKRLLPGAPILDDPSITLQTDQRRLSYSFNKGNVHFVMLNTDTETSLGAGVQYEGLTPVAWLQADLDQAQQEKTIEHIFVLGHRPVRPPSNFQGAKESDALNHLVAEPLRQALLKHPKVKAYIVSHAHLWCADSLANSPASPNTPPVQLVSGNGGTDLESFWKPASDPGQVWTGGEKQQPYYGFVQVKVFASGKVKYNAWQREAPAPFYTESSALAKPRPTDTEIK